MLGNAITSTQYGSKMILTGRLKCLNGIRGETLLTADIIDKTAEGLCRNRIGSTLLLLLDLSQLATLLARDLDFLDRRSGFGGGRHGCVDNETANIVFFDNSVWIL